MSRKVAYIFLSTISQTFSNDDIFIHKNLILILYTRPGRDAVKKKALYISDLQGTDLKGMKKEGLNDKCVVLS